MAKSMRRFVLVTVLILAMVFQTCPVFAAETGSADQAPAENAAAVESAQTSDSTDATAAEGSTQEDPAEQTTTEPAEGSEGQTEPAEPAEPQEPEEPAEPEPAYQAHFEYSGGSYYFYDENGEMVKGGWINYDGAHTSTSSSPSER